MPLHYSLLLVSVLLGVLGQLALKGGANDSDSFVRQCLHPLTIGGLAIYGLAALAYLFALRRIPLSIAFPSVAASYFLVALMAHFLWNEPLGIKQMSGLSLISLGIYLLHTTPNT